MEEYILPIAGLILFGIFAFIRYSDGRFTVSKYSNNTLFVLLFILPIILTSLSFWDAHDIKFLLGHYNAKAIIQCAAPIILLILSIIFLRGRKFPDIVFILLTLVLTVWRIIIIIINGQFVEIRVGWLFISDFSRYGLTSIFVLAILQFLYIHWIKCYYEGKSAEEREKSILTFDAAESSESINRNNEQTGMSSKKNDLYELKSLLDSGVLTKDEFEKEKQKILSR